MIQKVNGEREFTAKNILLFIVACCSACLCGINVSSIAAVMTTVTQDLGTDVIMVGWIMSIYSLVTYPSMIMIGRIGDLIGFKEAMLASCATFAIGSVGVALSPNVPLILLFRVIQAIGGGGLPTSCMSLVAKIFPNNRQKMMGMAVNVFPLAQIVGSNFGVWITDWTGSWRNLFWINVGLMVVSIVIIMLCMAPSKRDEEVSITQLDFLGAGLMCAAVCCLMVSITYFKDIGKILDHFGGEGYALHLWLHIGLFFALFLVLGFLFVQRVRKAKHPIVDREVLFNKKFSSVTAFFFVYGFVALGMAQMIPLFAKSVYNFSEGVAASVVMAKGIGWFLCGLVVAALIKKLGYRIPLVLCTVVIAASYFVIGLLSTQSEIDPEVAGYAGYIWLFIVAIVLGAGSGMASPTMTNAAVDLMPENVGTIYGVTAASRQIGSTLCTPIVTVIVTVCGSALGFRISFFVMTVLTLLCLAFVFKMPKTPSEAVKQGIRGGRGH